MDSQYSSRTEQVTDDATPENVDRDTGHPTIGGGEPAQYAALAGTEEGPEPVAPADPMPGEPGVVIPGAMRPLDEMAPPGDEQILGLPAGVSEGMPVFDSSDQLVGTVQLVYYGGASEEA